MVKTPTRWPWKKCQIFPSDWFFVLLLHCKIIVTRKFFLCYVYMNQTVWYVITVSAADMRGETTRAFVPGSQCKGPPRCAELVQTRPSEFGSSFTSQSSFSIRGSFRCTVNFKSAYFFALFVLPTQISTEMHTLSYLTTAQSARAPHIFLKPLNEDYCIVR